MSLIASLILISIVLAARIANKWRLPLVLIALSAGIIFGSDVLGLVHFNNTTLAKQLADLALVFVLFIGGFGTKRENLKLVMAPALTLATLGVIITAAVTGLALWLFLHYEITYALLLGAIIASTDAAAVFSILRTRSIKPKLAAITEVESATNDPMAILLTTFIIQILTANHFSLLQMSLSFLWQMVGGVLIGLTIGKIGCLLFDRIKSIDTGYFYILIIGIILLSFGLSELTHASGMLSAFFAGYVMGNTTFPYKRNISTFLEAISTIANVGIFIILGLLVFPREFTSIWLQGIIVFIVITFLSRPVTVFLCTIFSSFTIKEKIFLSWSGLRGAVPIVLAIYPAAAGLEGAKIIFNIIFFAVVISMIFQGITVGKLADYLKLTFKAKPKPRQVMELIKIHESDLELFEIYIDNEQYFGTAPISLLQLPIDTTITMINRQDRIIAPKGSTRIMPGDTLYVLINYRNVDLVMSEIFSHFNLKQEILNNSEEDTNGKKNGPPPE
jgi:cell volume regulation protein A